MSLVVREQQLTLVGDTAQASKVMFDAPVNPTCVTKVPQTPVSETVNKNTPFRRDNGGISRRSQFLRSIFELFR